MSGSNLAERQCGAFRAEPQSTEIIAAELKASLIVLGISRPGSEESAPLDHAVVDTIRKAHCPVLTVPSNG